MEKDWGTRFKKPPARFNRVAAGVATVYWGLTIAVFLALQSAGFDMIGDGAIPVAFLTFPWSVLLIMAHPSFHPAPTRPYYDPIVSPLGTFILLPIISGALNAALLYWLVAAVQRKRKPNG